MSATLPHFLIVSAALFCIGLMAVLSRRSAVFVLIGIELMLAAANINFVAFWRTMPAADHSPTGVMFVMFAIGIAAAEVAVGMALVIAVFRHNRSADVSKLDQLKG